MCLIFPYIKNYGSIVLGLKKLSVIFVLRNRERLEKTDPAFQPITYGRRSFMKSANRIKQWLVLLLCVVMTAGVLVQAAGAATATGKCTNLENEGVEYFTEINVMGSDVNTLRQRLNVYAVLQSDPTVSAGTVLGMDMEISNDNVRYTCTIDESGANEYDSFTGIGTVVSCNSVPVNAIISGIYFLYRPNLNVTIDTPIQFVIEELVPDAGAARKVIYKSASAVKNPPYPCARNILQRDFAAADNETLALYVNQDCNGNSLSKQVLNFYEKYDHPNKYSIVNIMFGDYLREDRFRISVSPAVKFDYDLTLIFGYGYNAATKTYGTDENPNWVYVTYSYDPNLTVQAIPSVSVTGYASELSVLTNSDLPLTLLGGTLSNVNAKGRLSNGWGGTPEITPNVELEVTFWYENQTGTLGYENSVFHFIRNLNIKFANTCSDTAFGPGLYDPCQQDRQMFAATLPSPLTIPAGTELYYGNTNPAKKIKVANSVNENKLQNFYFFTRKCVNAACDYVTNDAGGAYPAYIIMSDGGGSQRNYAASATLGAATVVRMRPYGTSSKPFAIKGVYMVVSEPGTYVVYAFANYNSYAKTTLAQGTDYYTKFYVTVNSTDELLTCSTLANNGYFQAWWNDCLSPSETQLIPFEHIDKTEEAWVRNRSAHAVDFPFVPEYSHLPQKLEIASLNCKFEALEANGRPGEGYCNNFVVHVPPYTKVTITGGTMYMSGFPEYDEYRAAYMREDTLNISHLIFHIGVKECESKKIPDTGISLRSPMSPLKVNEKVDASVDAATGYVFTGNSLRIPAIGLGMETPIPIVHVYYEDGSDNMVWDLSTLGNYVGELEGGSYLPYAGNSVLTGHYYSAGVFKNLEHLNYEDEIIIFANDGMKYTYKVVEKFIAQPNDVYEMFQQIGERSLTLVTCENYNLVTNEYERRQIIRATIVSSEPYYENY